ncbi:hypothetical protein CI15_03245 [Paraburkholderia monticola]|uniref:Acyltransferase 3 domain-containing protein n=1 Tax=Paraburkholderia monticola TaxID=1399968 RepID=A0A149Q133_9BURK|nr:acyltransferase [Paraburkholderia monticola]KXU90934.1 hypothetical protein CI15_03245 [Paraburkholderia monticola]
MSKNDRIVFLDYLRAIACLLVVVGHVYIIGYNGQPEIQPFVPGVTAIIFGPNAPLRNIFTPPLLWVLVNTGVNVGELGVCIFFLISGFVIQRAIERETTTDFLIKRALRIIPVALVASFLIGATTAIYCYLTHTVSPHSFVSLLASSAALGGYLHTFPSTPVLWTLAVEIMFYALVAIGAGLGLRGLPGILCIGICCAAFVAAVNASFIVSALSQSVRSELQYASFSVLQVPYLLIGSCIYRATSGDRRAIGFLHAVLLGCIYLIARYAYITEHGDSGGFDVPNGIAGLVVFATAMWSGMQWRWIRPLKRIANASYPLYMLHVPLGWIAFAWMASMGLGMVSTGIVTGFGLLLLSGMLHVFVELPAQRLGKTMTSRKDVATTAETA